MATTTNYGWTTPDDTALVKDGAAAIRSLGTSIDTTTKNLNPQTTTGAIAYRSSTSNVNTSLPLGTAGQLLAVNSGATAPEWQTITTGGMTLISTTTLSGASVVLSSIPGTYNNLFLSIRSFQPATDGASLQMRYNADTNTRYTNPDVGVEVLNRTFGGTSLFVGQVQDNGSTNAFAAITIFDYTNTATWKYCTAFGVANNATTTTNANLMSAHGLYNQTSAITSITLFPSSGNFTAGTALLYGVK